MSDRTRWRYQAALIVAFWALVPAAPAWPQQDISANDPVALGTASIEKPQNAANSPAVDAPKPAPVPPEQKTVAATAPPETPHPSPAALLESKLLGRPNSALSARPAEHSSVSESGALSRLDPRSNEVTRVLGALAIVLGLLLLVRAVFKRVRRILPARGDQPSGVLEILARYPVGRGQHLVLLKLARRIILVHQSSGQMTALTEMTDPDEVAGLLSRMEAGSSERGAAKFRNALAEFMADHDAARKQLPRRGELRGVETEVIDLTRRRARGVAGFLGQARRVSSS